MEYRLFESRILELLYKTDIKLVVQQAAFRTQVSVEEANAFLDQMSTNGVVTMEIDEDGNIFYDVPGRPPPSGEALSWGPDAVAQHPQGERSQVPILVPAVSLPFVQRPQKSVGVSLLLTFLFGPFGMLYSTVSGALTMLVAVIFFSVISSGAALLTYPVSMIWGATAAAKHNRRLRAEAQQAQEASHDRQMRMISQAQAFAARPEQHHHH